MSSPATGPSRPPRPGPVLKLVDDWQSASLASGWPPDEPWWLTEVEDVADALIATSGPAGSLIAACTDLGTARAQAGFDLAESRADLRVGLGLVGSDPVRSLTALDALTLGWIEATRTAAAEADSVDPLTRLASRDYLQVRLGELYAAAAKLGGTPAKSHELLTVRLHAAPEPLVRELRMVLLERALRSVLDAGQTIARLGPNVVVALVDTAGELRESVTAQLRASLDEWSTAEQLSEATIGWSALPDDPAEIPRAFSRICAGR